jgi:hypothetical protein
MSTLSESALRELLPKPDTDQVPGTPAPTQVPGTIVNTNPPAQGPGDALIFDPDENITYDPLQLLPRQSSAPKPVVTQTRPLAPSGNVVDLETTPAPTSSGGMGWTFWVILVAFMMVVSLIAFFVIRSSMQSTPQTQAGPSLDNFYGASR